ncbi:MAG: lipopolysaccharide transport periplasmic protein LptA [Gammaproteobacteria bacterium]|nr:MAG: lipopolysaccharide transport periplasmic protein LptA [Gammaproteobacteria bacterium]
MKYLLFATTLALAPALVCAQNKSATMPIDLVADSGFYDQMAGIAVYEGNVRAKQGDATIWAHKITITLKNNAADVIEAIGNKKSLVRFEFKGDKQPIKGQGQKATYQVPKKIVTLSQNAKIEQGKDLIKGNKLTYDLSKEIIRGSRVQMTFLPNKK